MSTPSNNGPEPQKVPDGIFAPYNFVPLSRWIMVPPNSGQISMEVPFADGLCGNLEFTLKAHTPLLVGGEQTAGTKEKAGLVRFFRGPDGKPLIPGTSLKGMIRNVMEIASFGKMRLEDDRWLSIRDLANSVKSTYRANISNIQLKPLCKAGFLRIRQGSHGLQWFLTPCEFVRVEQSELIRYATKHPANFNIEPQQAEHIKKRQNAWTKYKDWKPPMAVDFYLPDEVPGQKNGQVTPEHEKARLLWPGTSHSQQKRGYLVFTGQPQDNIPKTNRKHLEFVFYDCKDPEPVPEPIIKAFLQGHETTEDWQKRWDKMRESQPGIPVFFLRKPGKTGEIRAIGMAMMFRLPYAYSVGQLIDRANPGHRMERPLDLCESIFGTVNSNHQGLRGRVSFSHARVSSTYRRQKFEDPIVLNSPKPSYYPAYIQQPEPAQSLGSFANGEYLTYMQPNTKIRGWKRYPAHKAHKHAAFHQQFLRSQKDLPKSPNYKVALRLEPLEPGCEFRFKLRVHNLRPFELGALLWAISWGDDPQLRHGLGMGKPLGFGQVSLSLNPESWAGLRANQMGNQVPDYQACIAAFEQLMAKQWCAALKRAGYADPPHSWHQSSQITQLLAMANPAQAPGQPGSLSHMILNKDLNMFRDRKGTAKDSKRHVLLPYKKYSAKSDDILFRNLPLSLDTAPMTMQEDTSPDSPLANVFQQDLSQHKNQEHRVNSYWWPKLMANTGAENRDLAICIAHFFQVRGKYAEVGGASKRIAPKQKKKNQILRKILAQGKQGSGPGI